MVEGAARIELHDGNVLLARLCNTDSDVTACKHPCQESLLAGREQGNVCKATAYICAHVVAQCILTCAVVCGKIIDVMSKLVNNVT